MPAPDLPTLLDFEGQLKTALQAIVTNSSPSIVGAIFPQDAATTNAYGLALRLEVGGVLDGHFGRRPSGKVDFDFFEASFEIEAWANRDDNADNTSASYQKLETFRKNARTVFLEGNTPFAPYLTYLRVRRIRPLGSQMGLIPERQQDVCTLRFYMDFGIIPNAWPSAS